MKTIILTDSTSDISKENAKLIDVEVIALSVVFGDKSYKDGIEITKEEFFSALESSSVNPTTSQPSPEEFLEIFEKCKENGDSLIYIGISSKLSGTIQSAKIAKELCDYDKIYIIDSLNVTSGLEVLVRAACIFRDEGMPADKIAEAITNLVPKVRLFAMVDTLKYLVRGGRLPKVAGVVGGALGIKPLVSIKDGKLEAIGTARGQKNAFEKICDLIEKEPIDETLPIIITHSNDKQKKYEFEKFLVENGVKQDWLYGEVGTVVGTHAGPGAVGIVYFTK